MDIVFFVDIIINFLTPYEIPGNEYEFSSKKIAKDYIFGRFLIDIIAVIPTWALE